MERLFHDYVYEINIEYENKFEMKKMMLLYTRLIKWRTRKVCVHQITNGKWLTLSMSPTSGQLCRCVVIISVYKVRHGVCLIYLFCIDPVSGIIFYCKESYTFIRIFYHASVLRRWKYLKPFVVEDSSAQLSYGNIKNITGIFCKNKNSLNRDLHERSFSSPNPRTHDDAIKWKHFPCY